MISLFLHVTALFAWMTDAMIQEQLEQQMRQQNQTAPPPPGPPSTATYNPSSTIPPPDTPISSTPTTTVKTNDANVQGIYWLNLLDQRQYAASWLAGGSLLKDIIAQPQWIAAMEATRKPLGSTRSRKLSSTTTLTQLPNGTSGHFTQLVYQTQFSTGSHSERLIMVSLAHTGEWRVVGYRVEK